MGFFDWMRSYGPATTMGVSGMEPSYSEMVKTIDPAKKEYTGKTNEPEVLVAFRWYLSEGVKYWGPNVEEKALGMDQFDRLTDQIKNSLISRSCEKVQFVNMSVNLREREMSVAFIVRVPGTYDSPSAVAKEVLDAAVNDAATEQNQIIVSVKRNEFHGAD